MKRRAFLAAIPAAAVVGEAAQHPGFAEAAGAAPALGAECRYRVEAGAITIRNGEYFNNRPLYCAHRPAAALGGDRPLVRLIEEHEVRGTFRVGFERGGVRRWLDECGEVRMEYRCGRLRWEVEDGAWAGVKIVLEAVSFSGRAGFAARATVAGFAEGDAVVWRFGGAHGQRNAMWAFDPVLMAQDDGWQEKLSTVLRRGFEEDKCAGDVLRVEGGALVLGRTRVSCSAGVRLEGRVGVARAGRVCWAVGDEPGEAERAYEEAWAAAEALGRRVEVKTPESRLDAAMEAALHAVDSIYYPPVFRHGAMAWNVRLPGWRTMYGGTVLGWHERVEGQARFYLASQVKESGLREAEAEPATRLCEQSARSRLNGVGRVKQDAGHYDFQSQMFDQLIHAWRWTGSEELGRLLRETLGLHGQWMRECFDADDDGLYESYINTWPTDTVWYNGGGSVEESCYAYTVHRALADMGVEEERQRARCAKIRAALGSVLWVKDAGHWGAYVEQGGHRRVHEDAWVYSQFLPVDAGLATMEEALQALYYCEWGLENVRPPFGGRRVWSSNWVPSKWSARELYHGDNYHLALAHFQSGWSERGWEILRGNLLDCGYARVAPGSQSMAGAATDFGDILHPFCRVVVEGLFGYAPDLPNGVVRVRPGWPAEWAAASVRTPDFALTFRREGEAESYELTMARAARVEFALPVRCGGVRRVLRDGAETDYEVEAGVGCSVVRVGVGRCEGVRIRVEVTGREGAVEWAAVSGRAGEGVSVAVGAVVEVRDLSGALVGVKKGRGGVRARLSARVGHHLVLARVKVGALEQWRPIRVKIEGPPAAAEAGVRGGRWQLVDLSGVLNGDVRGIFRQRYLAPRPATVSVRLGVDGYSPWTFAPWKIDPPEIDLTMVEGMRDGAGRIVTGGGVRFAGIEEGRNIAFTSLWENWPRTVEAAVGAEGEAVWVLVAGSTNPMQTRIANAVLRFVYEDGVEERLELVPPLNFWSLCALGGRDYSYERDGYCLPARPPATVQLGRNCRAMVLRQAMRRGVRLKSVMLEALSQEVVIGLMGVSVEQG